MANDTDFQLSSKARSLLEQNWENIGNFFDAVISGDVSAKAKSIPCRTCGFRTEHPLIATTKDVMEIVRFLADRGIGRPGEQPKPPAAPPSTAKLEEASDDDLLAIIESEG